MKVDFRQVNFALWLAFMTSSFIPFILDFAYLVDLERLGCQLKFLIARLVSRLY
ncbi:hypothetical protein [Marinomonas pollencensis]|uniref:Uncharacterized protein n=1 Tax=Marinomonas pollencensis TaxID=491954 RepID=A0A3E0DRA7_9GAMM|nr:hypothetical protein [Marinomonas pollencensis]REG85631.1 hypothetical protein DFP81_102164 [Marinomonas pollencensis]